MKWDNLKKNRCPSCGKDWSNPKNVKYITEEALKTNHIVCNCGFKISNKRMREIVNDKINTELLEEKEK